MAKIKSDVGYFYSLAAYSPPALKKIDRCATGVSVIKTYSG
jgi:hypothetical protein